jgi:hypothetical protein
MVLRAMLSECAGPAAQLGLVQGKRRSVGGQNCVSRGWRRIETQPKSTLYFANEAEISRLSELIGSGCLNFRRNSCFGGNAPSGQSAKGYRFFTHA